MFLVPDRSFVGSIALRAGVESVMPDMAAGKVVVTGTADAVELKERIEARAKKPVQIVSAGAGGPPKKADKEKEKKADGGGEKKADKDKGGGGGGEKKADKEKGGGGEKKAEKEKGAGDKPKEEKKPKEVSYLPTSPVRRRLSSPSVSLVCN